MLNFLSVCLRHTLNVPVMQQPEAYIGHAADLFDDQGNIVNDSTRSFLQQFLSAYEQWVDTNNRK